MQRKFQGPPLRRTPQQDFLSVEPELPVALVYPLPLALVLVPVELKVLCLYDHVT